MNKNRNIYLDSRPKYSALSHRYSIYAGLVNIVEFRGIVIEENIREKCPGKVPRECALGKYNTLSRSIV